MALERYGEHEWRYIIMVSVCGAIALWQACVALEHYGECVWHYSVMVSVCGIIALC